MNKINVGAFRRISKRSAEKLYKEGKTIRLCACKLSPMNIYAMFADINIAKYDEFERPFKTIINAFSYYNCNYETGYYPAYYIREEQENDQNENEKSVY